MLHHPDPEKLFIVLFTLQPGSGCRPLTEAGESSPSPSKCIFLQETDPGGSSIHLSCHPVILVSACVLWKTCKISITSISSLQLTLYWSSHLFVDCVPACLNLSIYLPSSCLMHVPCTGLKSYKPHTKNKRLWLNLLLVIMDMTV